MERGDGEKTGNFMEIIRILDLPPSLDTEPEVGGSCLEEVRYG